MKKGKVGARVLTWERTFLDGKLYTRRRLSDRVAVKPVTQVVLVGTKARPQNSPEADGLNWAALARCESGGNPNAYNPAGPYYGLYQFLASTWHSVGGTGVPDRPRRSRADLPRADPLQAQWCGAVAGVRPVPLSANGRP